MWILLPETWIYDMMIWYVIPGGANCGAFNCFFGFFEDRRKIADEYVEQKRAVATAIDGIVLAQNDRLIDSSQEKTLKWKFQWYLLGFSKRSQFGRKPGCFFWWSHKRSGLPCWWTESSDLKCSWYRHGSRKRKKWFARCISGEKSSYFANFFWLRMQT